MIYTVTLNPAIDYLLYVKALREGEVCRAEDSAVFFGGKGLNVSKMLGVLGVESTALAFYAGFTGEALLQKVREAGIRADFIRLSEGLTRINVKIKAEKETDLNGPGPRVDAAAVEALFAKLDRLKAGDVLCLSGSLPPSLPADFYAKLLCAAAKREVDAVVDTSGAPLLHALAHRPFLIKPNRDELGELVQAALRTPAEVEAAARRLQAAGARNVLVSLGGEGALLLTEAGDCRRLAAPVGRVKNSVGAGDSMVAGFLAGYRATGDFGEALHLGVAAGSATAFSEGLADRPLIDRLLQQI